MPDEKIELGTEDRQPEIKVKQEQLEQFILQIESEQNFMAAVIAGVAAALIGAIIWAVITATTKYQIGWMAVGIGFLVGVAVRYFGKGIDQKFGIVGAVLSLLGCLAGNFLFVVVLVAQSENIPILSLLANSNLEIIFAVIANTFEVIDLLFYGIAVYAGYRFSFRRLTEEEFAQNISG